MIENNNIGSAEQPAKKQSSAAEAGDQDQVDLTNAEWVQIATDKVVVATKNRAWLYKPRSAGDRFTQPMEGSGSFTTTQKLLDTVIAAARYAVRSDIRPPALTSIRWVWRLAGAYRMTSPVPDLMREAANGFAANGRFELEKWALEKAEEEIGHDRLALLDIQSLGYDAEAVVNAFVPPAARALMDYFTRSVRDSDPIDCVGYTYTMERLSLGIGEEYIHSVEKLLPPEINATRCLRVHSAVGADAHHANENVSLIAGLLPSERTRVARACYETALMCFSPPPGGYVSEDELVQFLQPLRSH